MILTFLISLMFVQGVYSFLIFRYARAFRQSARKVISSTPVFHGAIPRCSVVIPVRNEASHIRRILREMVRQDYPAGGLEVIVSDDFSEDGTLALVQEFVRDHPGFPLVLVAPGLEEAARCGKKHAITRAVEHAAGDVVLCTDADTVHPESWVRAMMGGFARRELQMALGPVVYREDGNLLQRLQAVEYAGIMGSTAGSAALGYPVMCNGANLAYRREAFAMVGGFIGNMQYASGDDQFLMAAVRRRYGKTSVGFVTDPGAIVTTAAAPTLAAFFQQRIRWISKSTGYRDPVVIAVGMVAALSGWTLAAGLVAGLFYPVVLRVTLGLWVLKMAADYLMVNRMERFAGREHHPWLFLLAQGFQMAVVPVVSVLALVWPVQWKGRKI